ncbi:unnamed protein product, partial [Ectocarpus sp. 6 AP-2014]
LQTRYTLKQHTALQGSQGNKGPEVQRESASSSANNHNTCISHKELPSKRERASENGHAKHAIGHPDIIINQTNGRTNEPKVPNPME